MVLKPRITLVVPGYDTKVCKADSTIKLKYPPVTMLLIDKSLDQWNSPQDIQPSSVQDTRPDPSSVPIVPPDPSSMEYYRHRPCPPLPVFTRVVMNEYSPSYGSYDIGGSYDTGGGLTSQTAQKDGATNSVGGMMSTICDATPNKQLVTSSSSPKCFSSMYSVEQDP